MNFINKATVMAFRQVNTVLLTQMLVTALLMSMLRAVGVIDFPAFSTQKARNLLPVVLLYNVNVLFALMGLQ